MNHSKYSHLTEDESVHNRFTAYVVLALRRQKAEYLAKKARAAKMFVSLDEMIELRRSDPALAIPFGDDEISQLLQGKEVLENLISNDRLLIGILKLNDRDRKILNLRLIWKMKHSEIADILDLNAKTVEKAYERLIKKLREQMRGCDM